MVINFEVMTLWPIETTKDDDINELIYRKRACHKESPGFMCTKSSDSWQCTSLGIGHPKQQNEQRQATKGKLRPFGSKNYWTLSTLTRPSHDGSCFFLWCRSSCEWQVYLVWHKGALGSKVLRAFRKERNQDIQPLDQQCLSLPHCLPSMCILLSRNCLS